MSNRKAKWTATAWLGLLLMLFNVFNATTMGLRPMAAMAHGDMPLCAEHQMASGHHHQDPTKPGSSDNCSCCLSMCCMGAAVPDSDPLVPARVQDWTFLTFGASPSFSLNPAPRSGGGARAPPSFA